MTKVPYWQKLQDPRWQKKRLEIFERDRFECRGCNSKEKMLTVHHSYYVSGRMPWNYPDGTLITLCNNCHKITQEIDEQNPSTWEIEAEFLANCGVGSGPVELSRSIAIAAGNTGWPDPEILFAFMAACEAGVIDAETLKGWNDDVRALRKVEAE